MLSQLHRRKRAAFTLLELLIVIAIIAILMGLSLRVMFGLLGQAEEQATVATVRKIDALLQQKMEAFDRAYRGPRATSAESNITAILASQKIFGVRSNVIEILARKAAFRTAFPQRMEELLVVDSQLAVPGMADSFFKAVAEPGARLQQQQEGKPTDATAVKNRAIANWNTKHNPETESSELLYYCLVVADSFGAAGAGGDRFTNREVADTDEDGLPEFVDAWGNPLRFYRWPTRLIDVFAPSPFDPILTDPSDPTDNRVIAGLERQVAQTQFQGLAPPPITMPNGVTPRDMLLVDPDDPVGVLYSELERLNGLNGMPDFKLEFNELKYHTAETYHTPLVVSAGPDGAFGIQPPGHFKIVSPGVYEFGNLAQLEGMNTNSKPPIDPAVLDKLFDNISNRNRRAGAKR